MNPDLHNDNFITFQKNSHQYFDSGGTEYTSISRIIESIKNLFDRDGISKGTATSLGLTQEQVLDRWDKLKNDSIDFGNIIHNGLEDYFNAKKINDKRVKELAMSFSKEIYGYNKIRTEHILYDREYKYAGTCDLLLDRHNSRSKIKIVDLMDYKTNLSRGIYFDSIRRKNGKTTHSKKFLLNPLNHLEECNYNLYSLQLSGYGYMLEKTYGIKIGKLFIVWIRYSNETDSLYYTMIPVPYMKFEIESLFNHFKKLKKI